MAKISTDKQLIGSVSFLSGETQQFINLKYMLKELFAHPYGQGYPEARREIQVAARRRLEKLSALSHRSMEEILDVMDPIVLHTALDFPGIRACVEAAPESSLKRKVLEIYAHA